MKKVEARCWKDEVQCANGETVEIYFTISDFYEGRRLFIHPSCGAIFAVDPEAEHYQKKEFQQLKNNLNCPECGKSLKDVLPYPDHYRCPSTGAMERYNRLPNAAPPNRDEFVIEFWDPLT
jgi:rubredoxin